MAATILPSVQLYLVRHAEAADGEPDELRPLTAEGRRAARELGERLAAVGVRPDAVLTSPLLRARQTGAELARAAGIEPEPDERLAPGATADDVKAAAAGRGENVVVVGHQPDCGRIAAALTGGEEPSFAPAAMLAFELS
jgi:phosphohistidine phosphatase